MTAKLISFCEEYRESRASYWNRTVAELPACNALHFTPLFPRWVALRARQRERGDGIDLSRWIRLWAGAATAAR